VIVTIIANCNESGKVVVAICDYYRHSSLKKHDHRCVGAFLLVVKRECVIVAVITYYCGRENTRG